MPLFYWISGGSLEGHPYYPTWKCRSNLSPESIELLSPEFDAIVPVRIAALRADMAYIETMPDKKITKAGLLSNFLFCGRNGNSNLIIKNMMKKNGCPYLSIPGISLLVFSNIMLMTSPQVFSFLKALIFKQDPACLFVLCPSNTRKCPFY